MITYSRLIRDLDWSVVNVWAGPIGFVVPMAISLSMNTVSALSLEIWLLAIAVGIFSFLSQTLLLLALHYEGAGSVSILLNAYNILMAYGVQVNYSNPIAFK